MHIKQIIIEGFKSYREQVATEPFSPQVNCVVGANGSGKTNFFHAIRFVLSDLFQSLRMEDRQSLLHEGAGQQVLSAFVEIVFDNKDNRIPVDRDELRLRRVIGLKKDEYWLDKKHITKTEVQNLLESAGFSRSNPFYVVQQGKIATLSLQKDTERLSLLKEIGGARVYEERRKESVKAMQDAGNQRQRVVEVLEMIEERLKQLDEEKEELKQFDVLDKQRRSLEFTIYEKELQEAREGLERIEVQRAAAQEASKGAHERSREVHEALKAADKQVKAVQQSMAGMGKEEQAAEEARSATIAELTRLELDAKDMKKRMDEEEKRKRHLEQEAGQLQQSIAEAQNQLATIQPRFEEQQQREADTSRSLTEVQRELERLYEKAGRRSQFASVRERDDWLRKDIAGIRAVVEKKQQQVAGLEHEMAALHKTKEEVEAESSAKQEELKGKEQQIATCNEKLAAARGTRDESSNRRRVLMRQEAELSGSLKQLSEEKNAAEAQLDKSSPNDIRRGLLSLRQIVNDHKVQGVYGTILELISCEDRFTTAVEVTAGNSLYNMVVDTDETAARLVKHLNAQRGGRITFIPLNQARASNITYPNSKDIVPLISKINFDDRFKRAFGQVFGRAIICRNLDVASEFARSGDFDCITLEGSQVERKGAMTGGHYDPKRSKLRLMRVRNECNERGEAMNAQLVEVKTQLTQLDQAIAVAMGEMEKWEAERRHWQQQAEEMGRDMKEMRAVAEATEQAIQQKMASVQSLQQSVTDDLAAIEAREQEMGTALAAGMSREEKETMSRLNKEAERLTPLQLQQKKRRIEIEREMASIESQLTQNLLKRQAEVQEEMQRLGSGSSSGEELEECRAQLRAAQAAADDARKEQKIISERINNASREMRELKMKRDELKQEEAQCERLLQDNSKATDAMLTERNLLQQRRDEVNKKIRDLGSLPADAFEKYHKHGLKELHRLLHRCNEKLKKYGKVNKKALDMYVSFIEQREEMRRRKADLDLAEEKISELISVLDQRKDEALERTFKQVARNFKEAFSELVPHGHGSLVMVKKKRVGDVPDDDDENEDGAAEGEGEGGGGLEKYIGVRVKVSFTGHGDTQSMRQLSGGQKTVVALSLIFAIQRCDPAPFYLFDEIDAALDPQYRSAVGNMIRRQADSSHTQFIITTFRPELVKVADKVYGVFHRNRVSDMRVIDTDNALQFIENEQAADQE